MTATTPRARQLRSTTEARSSESPAPVIERLAGAAPSAWCYGRRDGRSRFETWAASPGTRRWRSTDEGMLWASPIALPPTVLRSVRGRFSRSILGRSRISAHWTMIHSARLSASTTRDRSSACRTRRFHHLPGFRLGGRCHDRPQRPRPRVLRRAAANDINNRGEITGQAIQVGRGTASPSWRLPP